MTTPILLDFINDIIFFIKYKVKYIIVYMFN